MAMEWPDAAHAVFAELPTEHRVAALYVILAIGGVAVLMAIRKLLASAAVPAAVPAPGPPVNVQIIPFEQAVAAMRTELKAQLNGSLGRIEEKQDALEAKLDALEEKVGVRHAENQREIGEISGLLKALDRLNRQ